MNSSQTQHPGTSGGIFNSDLLPSVTHAFLQDGEASFRAFAEALPLLVWTASADGNVDYANQHCMTYTGLSSQEKFGQGWTQSVHPDDLKVMGAKWMMAIRNGERFEAEYRLMNAAGNYRWFLGRAVLIEGASGQFQKWIGTATDIDEQKQALQTRDETLAIVSHDLRNPLGAILMNSQLIQRYMTDERALRAAQSIYRQALRMEQMISDLMDAARLESGHLELKKKPHPLSSLVSEALASVEGAATLKEITFEVSYAVPEATLVQVDEVRMLQILSNLLDNAIKFSPNGALIRLEMQMEELKVRISIADQGPGIPSENLERIFERYWQAEGEQRKKGMGLGLFIVKGILEAHEGEVRVESRVGQGSTFSVLLPV